MNYYIYFLKSEIKDKWIYVGSTNNLEKRLNEHNQGKNKSTKAYRPLKIIYQEEFHSEKEAREREKYFKRWDGRNEKKKILSNIN